MKFINMPFIDFYTAVCYNNLKYNILILTLGKELHNNYGKHA